MCGRFTFTRRRHCGRPWVAGQQVEEIQEVRDAQCRAPLADDELWIRGDDVRPLPWHGADAIVANTQQEPRAVAVVPFANTDELVPAERVERVRYAHKARRCLRRTSILV